MISKIAARRPPVSSQSVGTAAKKLAQRAAGYADKSAFEGVKQTRQAIGKAVGGVREQRQARRQTLADFDDIKRGLRTGNSPAVKVAVAATAARLDVKLPNLTSLSGWGAVGALGSAVGHVMKDPLAFNRDDFKGVMKLAAGVRINDPDPSNGRLG